MVDLRTIKNIYLYSDVVDFRKGLKSLTNLVLTKYNRKDVRDSLFVFFGRDKQQIKMLEIENDGVWLYQKYLNHSEFIIPEVEETIKIDKRQLLLILHTLREKRYYTKEEISD